MAGVEVTYDESQEWVLIKEGHREIYLQDYQATELIEEIKRLESMYNDESEGHEILAVYPYGDMLAEM